MKKYILVIMAILLLLAYGCAQNTQEDETANVDNEANVVKTADDGGVLDVAETADVEAEQTTKSTPSDGTVIVNINGFAFNPETITIPAGTVVTWINKDDVKHTATSDEEVFDSPLLGKDEKFSHTFSKPGTFTYYCKPHPDMVGIVIVE